MPLPSRAIQLFLLAILSIPGFSQIPEDIRFGLYGRTEQNIYRYYYGLSRGNFSTQRVSNGYSAGATVHASVNYLLNAGMSLGMSEAGYAPNIQYGNNILWNVRLRLWQFNMWGELKLGPDEEQGTRVILGGEWMIKEYKREIWSQNTEGEISWPHTRFMPRIGLGYEYPVKKKWIFNPNTGLRLAFHNRMGYDYVLNQFWAGLNIYYRLHQW